MRRVALRLRVERLVLVKSLLRALRPVVPCPAAGCPVAGAAVVLGVVVPLLKPARARVTVLCAAPREAVVLVKERVALPCALPIVPDWAVPIFGDAILWVVVVEADLGTAVFGAAAFGDLWAVALLAVVFVTAALFTAGFAAGFAAFEAAAL